MGDQPGLYADIYKNKHGQISVALDRVVDEAGRGPCRVIAGPGYTANSKRLFRYRLSSQEIADMTALINWRAPAYGAAIPPPQDTDTQGQDDGP